MIARRSFSNLINALAALWLVGNDLVTTFLGQRMRDACTHGMFLPASCDDQVVDRRAFRTTQHFDHQIQLAFLGRFRNVLLFRGLAVLDTLGFFLL